MNSITLQQVLDAGWVHSHTEMYIASFKGKGRKAKYRKCPWEFYTKEGKDDTIVLTPDNKLYIWASPLINLTETDL